MQHCIVGLRDLDIMKIEAEVSGELRNLVLAEMARGDKMARESN